MSGIFSDIISGPHSGLLTVTIAKGLDYHPDDRTYYLCVQNKSGGEFLHKGPDQTLRILTTKPLGDNYAPGGSSLSVRIVLWS